LKRIGLISDTHSFLDEQVFTYFEKCDEIWHAGDFGNIALAEKLAAFKPLKGVYGNIDGQDIRAVYPEVNAFTCEEVKVLMIHIGGYPPKYNPNSRPLLKKHKPKLFICGHSHILKVIYDEQLACLHINPGAAGREGWQDMRTIMRFTIDGADIKDAEIIKLGKR
jgi:putative phosphoesterase